MTATFVGVVCVAPLPSQAELLAAADRLFRRDGLVGYGPEDVGVYLLARRLARHPGLLFRAVHEGWDRARIAREVPE